jgi:hypothetical protein
MAEANRRGIRVLVDLVLNHSSSEHPWFKSAMLDPDSPYRDWFRWSATKPDGLGPWGQEVWHRSPLRDEYYYAVFWGGMPDLELDNPAVNAEIRSVARFWLQEMGWTASARRGEALLRGPEGGRAMNHPGCASTSDVRRIRRTPSRSARSGTAPRRCCRTTRTSSTATSPSRSPTASSTRRATARRASSSPRCSAAARRCRAAATRPSSATTTRRAR